MTLAFYPRGGSAQVARYLAHALERDGLQMTLCTGSLGPPGSRSHAESFFGGLDVRSLDFTESCRWYDEGLDPMAAPIPIHPSFEDRARVPDRVFASLGPAEYGHQVSVWSSALERIGRPDLYHVHHLTHVNDAVLGRGDIPVVVQLHGTELKMLAAIRDEEAGPWAYASTWRQRLMAAAHRARRIVVNSPSVRDLASELLELNTDAFDVVANGVDLELFSADPMSADVRLDHWHRWLVDDPQGWDESGDVGSIRYSNRDVEQGFLDPATGDPLDVLLYVGRFLHFKRVPLLIRAYNKARSVLGPTAPPLVIWGGFPGEWEGDHPHTVASAMGVDSVFFAGWRGHEELPLALNCADVFIAPSVDEPFGQVYLEAMASGLPVIATNSGGPRSFVNTRPAQPNGWLVAPDDENELAAGIIAAGTGAGERRRRGRRGRELIERDFDWNHIAQHYEAIYAQAVDGHEQVVRSRGRVHALSRNAA